MITTQGFGAGTTIQPVRYTPVDPDMVVMDPRHVTEGVLAQFKIADEKQKLDAFRHLQEEVMALRKDRMASHKANYARDVLAQSNFEATSPGVVAATNASNAETAAVAPVRTENTLGELSSKIEQRPYQDRLALSELSSKIALASGKAKIDKSNQDTEVATLGDKSAAALNEAAANRIKSETSLDNADLTAEVSTAQAKANVAKAQLELSKATDDLASAPQDRARKDALEQAKIDLDNANKDYLNAHADYYKARADGTIGGKPVDAAAQSRKAEREIRDNLKKTMSQVIGATSDGSPITLGQYYAQSRDGTGKIKEDYKPGEDGYNRLAEDLVDEIEDHRAELDQLRKKRNEKPPAEVIEPIKYKSVTGAKPVEQETAADEAQLSEEEQALAWAKSHPKDPRAAAILKITPVK